MKIWDDVRPIKAMFITVNTMFIVGKNNVTKIVPYQENGEMAPVLWFEVYNGDTIINRVNSKYVTLISYIEDEQ